MLRFALALLCLAVAAQAKTRVSRLPTNVWRRPSMRTNIDERIVGGVEVVPNSIPYQVSVQYDLGGGGFFHFCGGAIYDERNVVTAAHCCDGERPSYLQVVAGEHRLFVDEGEEQTLRVVSYTKHENYSPRTLENDICILHLSKPFVFNDAVSLIPMPEEQEEFTGYAEVFGWGTLSSGGSSSDVLMSVKVPIVSDTECRKSYGESDVAESMMCAGEAGKDSCQGDSGGPLNCGGVHCGIASWGRGCALAGYPGVYTQTSYFVDWIKDHVITP